MSKKKGLKRGSQQYIQHITTMAQDEARKQDRNDKFQRHVARQMAMDAATIVLSRLWGFGPTRQLRFHVEWEKVMDEIAAMMEEDFKDDKEAVYSKHQIDTLLKRAVGEENFSDWDERYSF